MSEAVADERLHALESKHRALHNAVLELERRVYLTPEEQRQVTDLKKRKLRAKDELFRLRRTEATA